MRVNFVNSARRDTNFSYASALRECIISPLLMPLAVGTVLGQYEIRSPLGAGGMGEVYRAHDRRLNREVAIKVLPESLTSDPDRSRRFEQEARAAAALNHPNILAVYQMATQSGISYLVSERALPRKAGSLCIQANSVNFQSNGAIRSNPQQGWQETVCGGRHYARRVGTLRLEVWPVRALSRRHFSGVRFFLKRWEMGGLHFLS